jgi:uncharacterized membrane protein
MIKELLLSIYMLSVSTLGFKKYKQLIFILALQSCIGVYPIKIASTAAISAALMYEYHAHMFVVTVFDILLIWCYLMEYKNIQTVIWSHLGSGLITYTSLNLFDRTRPQTILVQN